MPSASSSSSSSAAKTDPKLWNRIVARVKRGAKGGEPGEWSARKAQLATQEYKKSGGGYEGKKDPSNHLAQWTREEWGTKSGARSKDTGERYLPKKARAKLTDAEHAETSAKKRADRAKGKQFSAQPKAAREKSAAARKAPAAAPRRAAATARKPAAAPRRPGPDAARQEFREAVNMTASALERHLQTRRSQEVGFKRSGRGESVGHGMGGKIVDLLRRRKGEEFDREDRAAMRKVVGYIRRHLAQRPKGEAKGTNWAVSLKNWGHDPTK